MPTKYPCHQLRLRSEWKLICSLVHIISFLYITIYIYSKLCKNCKRFERSRTTQGNIYRHYTESAELRTSIQRRLRYGLRRCARIVHQTQYSVLQLSGYRIRGILPTLQKSLHDSDQKNKCFLCLYIRKESESGKGFLHEAL